MSKEKQLFVCNSVYQILVALWLKYVYHMDDKSDLIISDHMNDATKLVNRIKQMRLFDNVYFVKSLDFAKFKTKLSRKQQVKASLFPNNMLKKFVKLQCRYDELYIANVDFFSQLLFDALRHKNSNTKLTIYEDGLFTYSRLYEKDYQSTCIPVTNILKQFIHSFIYQKTTIYGNVSRLLLFNPDNLMWHPHFKIESINKIQREDLEFRKICNFVFSYSDDVDMYDKKYIFMEESFSAEGAELNDVEVLNQLAKRVGKENIMVKIHPRNPENRFAKLGYKTNMNTSIPWEVILMNLDISHKVLITVSSSSILNPILIFGQKVKAYSIYKCVDHEHCNCRLLSGEMWEAAKLLFEKYGDMISICESVDEID